MAKSLKQGDIVVISFPFSNLKSFKRRPALVLATAEFDDIILCQITSKTYTSKQAIEITVNDFRLGGLNQKSYVRPDKLFTVSSEIILKEIGTLNDQKMKEILVSLRRLFKIK